LGKYDATMAGSLVWYFEEGITGEIILPGTLNDRGLSHITAYNKVIPEPTTFIVWSLLGLSAVVVKGRRNRQA
jgi:hypothetical protein